MRKALWPAAIALVASGGINLARAESLEEALVATYSSNKTLASQRTALRVTDESVPQALSGWRPTVTMTGSVGRGTFKSNTSSTTPFERVRSPKTEAIVVSQPLFRGGRTLAGTQQARSLVMSGRAQLTATEQAVLLAAATAYLDVVRDEEIRRLSVGNEQVLQRQYELVGERFRASQVTRTDISQAEARSAGAVSDRTAAEAAVQNSRAAYLKTVGHFPETPAFPEAAPLPYATLDDILKAALADNPGNIAAAYLIEAATAGIELVAGELLPTLSLNADATRSLQTSTMKSETHSVEALLSLSVPLYEGGATYARLRAARLTLAQRRTEADQAKLEIAETATRAWQSFQATSAQVKSLERQVRAAEIAFGSVQDEANVGTRTVLDVLNAQQELFNARVSQAKARHDQYVASYQIRSATGKMTARELGLPVELYDPVKFYEQTEGKWIGWGIDDER